MWKSFIDFISNELNPPYILGHTSILKCAFKALILPCDVVNTSKWAPKDLLSNQPKVEFVCFLGGNHNHQQRGRLMKDKYKSGVCNP